MDGSARPTNSKVFKLQHPAGLVITPQLSLNGLLATLPNVASTRRDMGTGWAWYSLPRFEDGAVVVSVALGFEGALLSQLQLSDGNPRFGSGWSDWSEENERLRAESISAWLAAQGLPSGKYSWGEVWSGYDAKGGFGLAGVRFF